MDYVVLTMVTFACAAVVHALVVRQILKVMRSIDRRLDALSVKGHPVEVEISMTEDGGIGASAIPAGRAPGG